MNETNEAQHLRDECERLKANLEAERAERKRAEGAENGLGLKNIRLQVALDGARADLHNERNANNTLARNNVRLKAELDELRQQLKPAKPVPEVAQNGRDEWPGEGFVVVGPVGLSGSWPKSEAESRIDALEKRLAEVVDRLRVGARVDSLAAAVEGLCERVRALEDGPRTETQRAAKLGAVYRVGWWLFTDKAMATRCVSEQRATGGGCYLEASEDNGQTWKRCEEAGEANG